jgi:zinc/manganese transport system permease protein
VSIYLELFGASLAALACLAVAAPAFGAFLHARGTVLQGLALPQAALAGIAIGALIEGAGHAHAGHTHTGSGIAFGWAAVGTLLGLCAVGVRWRSSGVENGRAAVVFCVASALAVLLPTFSPTGALHLEARTRGEILAIGGADLIAVAAATAVVVATLVRTWRHVLLVGQDPTAARVHGLSVLRTNLVFNGCVAVVTVVGTATAGPLATFGLLVVPAIGCQAGAPSMRAFLARSSMVGLVGASLSVALSFWADLPLGPCVVVGCLPATLVARVVWRTGS